jgi:tetratricopeptide (TPR) repeat protein
MEIRTAAVVSLILSVLVGGCAGGAARTDGAGFDPADLLSAPTVPAWVDSLPRGTEPREDAHTRNAEDLLQAAAFSLSGERERHLEAAMEAARRGIEADSLNPLPWLQAGRAALMLERHAAAARLLDRAEALHPPYRPRTMELRERAWIERYLAAVALQEEGDLAGATDAFTRAHAIYRLRPEAMLRLAELHAATGGEEDALALLAEAEALVTGPWNGRMDSGVRAEWDSTFALALEARGRILLRLERYAEAAAVYGELLRVEPDHVEALSLQAGALVAAGESAEARDLFGELLEREGLDASDYFTAALGLYDVGDFQAAARAFREAHLRVPQHREAVLGLSQALYMGARWEELLPVTERLLQVDPFNPDAYRLRVQALNGAERLGEAGALLEEMERLPFSVGSFSFRPWDRGVVLVGAMTNHSRPAGSVVRFRVHFYDAGGVPVGSGDHTVRLPDPGETVPFQVTAPSVAGLFGYRYQVLGG